MTNQKKPIQAVVFDAYGTLFDVHSVMEACEEFYPGDGKMISQIWRQKQLEYSWLLSLMERYEPFESITRRGLIFALRSRNLPFDEPVLKRLMGEYRRLGVFPEAFAALERMKDRKLAILSNGNPEMLEPLLEYTGIEKKIPLLLSVEEKKNIQTTSNRLLDGAGFSRYSKRRNPLRFRQFLGCSRSPFLRSAGGMDQSGP